MQKKCFLSYWCSNENCRSPCDASSWKRAMKKVTANLWYLWFYHILQKKMTPNLTFFGKQLRWRFHTLPNENWAQYFSIKLFIFHGLCEKPKTKKKKLSFRQIMNFFEIFTESREIQNFNLGTKCAFCRIGCNWPGDPHKKIGHLPIRLFDWLKKKFMSTVFSKNRKNGGLKYSYMGSKL